MALIRPAAPAVFAAAFAAYLGCLYPAVAPRDSSDLAAAAMTLGVAHPPGYPLFSVLGRAWLKAFPLGNPAYRLNVLSALAGAAAAAGLFALVRRRAGALGGLAAAALWSISAPLWKFSLLAESYSLLALFAVGLLILAEGGHQSVFVRARLSGLVLGLGLVNHQSLLFIVPGLLWLWRAEAARRRVSAARLLAAAGLPLLAGLSLYAFLWVRLEGLQPALATALRLRYGAGTLFAGMARPLTPESGGELLSYAARATALAVSWPAALAAIVGAGLAWRADRARAQGWMLAGLGGALFILLSRFDPGNPVAREILEPALLLPCLAAAAFAGETLGALSTRPAAAAAAGLAASALFLHGPPHEHRDDFLAYDYVRDLRRAVPPGGALLMSGDTTSFGLRWLSLLSPEAVPRETADAPLVDGRAWLAARAGRRDLFVTGIGIADMKTLGLPSPEVPVSPEGLVQRVGAKPPTPAPLSVLRRPRGWGGDDSYVHNVKLSYGYASWAAARLLEAQDLTPPESYDLTAVTVDPADYSLEE